MGGRRRERVKELLRGRIDLVRGRNVRVPDAEVEYVLRADLCRALPAELEELAYNGPL